MDRHDKTSSESNSPDLLSVHELYRLMSVATLQAIEDRGNFYRLDWRLLSPFVLTLVHLGKDILTQATFGAWEAVGVG